MISPRIVEKYQRAHDEHLQAAAKSKRYDSIHTAALRAGYPGPFQAEGIAYAQWMDECNATGYLIMAEFESGVRGPLSVAEYIALLPTLELP